MGFLNDFFKLANINIHHCFKQDSLVSSLSISRGIRLTVSAKNRIDFLSLLSFILPFFISSFLPSFFPFIPPSLLPSVLSSYLSSLFVFVIMKVYLIVFLAFLESGRIYTKLSL